MFTHSHLLLVCLASAGSAAAGVPGKAGLDRYEHLWENSPICAKPVEKSVAAKAFLSDWLLGGVSEVEGGYLVTLNHRHNAGERLIIRPTGVDHCFPDRVAAMAPGDFRIERVELAREWRDLEVHLTTVGEKGTLKFEDKSLLPAATPAVPVRPTRLPIKR